MKTICDEQWEKKVLAYDPHGGDKGGNDVRLIRDIIVTARKVGKCVDCGMIIQPKTRIRVMTGVDSERIISIRTCQDCCDAMALFDEDDGEAMIARYSRGLVMG